MKSIFVIGGGFVGISTAIWLQRLGQKVTLVDRNVSRSRASFGNAGVLASSSIVPVTTPGMMTKMPKMLFDPKEPLFVKWSYLPKLAPWALRYLKHSNNKDATRIGRALTPILGKSLEDHLTLAKGTKAEARIHPSDFAFFYKDRDHFKSDAFAWSLRESEGFKWETLKGSFRNEYDPVFAPNLTYGARLEGHGRIDDPNAYLDDLTEHFIESGGTHIVGDVKDIAHENGLVTGVQIDQEVLPAKSIAITAGAWSPLLTKKLGLRIPVEAESGYHIELWEPNLMPRSPTLIPSGKFIATPMNGRLRVAGMVEFGGLNNEGSQEPYDLLRENIKKAIPRLTWKKETQWMGHRPAPVDSVPIIDELPNIKGVFLGFGHQHVGLTGSAKTGQLLAQLVLNKKPNIDLSAYSCTRFI